MKKFLQLLAAAFFSASACLQVRATLIDVHYVEKFGTSGTDGVAEGGPEWRGLLDTTTSKLAVYEWREHPGVPNGWTPQWTPELTNPWVWNAVKFDSLTNATVPYTVPDNFADIWTTQTKIGFVSQISNQDVTWKTYKVVGGVIQRDGNGNPIEEPVAFTSFLPSYVGWGTGAAQLGTDPADLTYEWSAVNLRGMRWLPNGAPVNGEGQATTASPFYLQSHVTVTLTAIPNQTEVGPSAVPESSAFVFGLASIGVIGGGATGARLVRSRRHGA